MTRLDTGLDKLGRPARVCPPPKRYKIGELADFTGLTRQTLHNYTRWGLIREVAWTQGGHRLYDETVFARLAQIMTMRPQHTVAEIRAALDRQLSHLGEGK